MHLDLERLVGKRNSLENLRHVKQSTWQQCRALLEVEAYMVQQQIFFLIEVGSFKIGQTLGTSS